MKKKIRRLCHSSKIYIFTLFIYAVDMQISFYLSIHSCSSVKALFFFLSDHIFLLLQRYVKYWMLKKISRMSTYPIKYWLITLT